MQVKPVVYDNGAQRKMMPGDVLRQGEVIPTTSTDAASGTTTTFTAAQIVSGIIIKTVAASGYTATTDTASNIIAAAQPASPGDTFRLRILNTVAVTGTLAGGTGVTLGTVPSTAVTASSFKEYLVTLTNTTPTLTCAADFTTTTKVITGMTQAQTNAISVGMLVTGTSVGASSVVTSIQPGVGCNVSVNSTGTVVGGAVTFSPTVRIDAITMG